MAQFEKVIRGGAPHAPPREQAEMCRILDEALDAGCCGFSAQILGENSVQRDFDGTPTITNTIREGAPADAQLQV